MKAFFTVLALCAFAQSIHGQSNIIEVANTLGLTQLKTYLDLAQLTDVLAGTAGSPFTVFAPTNAAFDALPQDVKDALAADPTGLLADTLKYHVIGGAKVMSTDLANDLVVESLYTGNNIRINIYGSTVLATGCAVSNPDNNASNGVIHIVDKVMMPPQYNVVEYAQNNGFSNLTDLVVRAGLANALSGGNLTVFAPTNAAFAKVPSSLLQELLDDNAKLTKVLTYHVVATTAYSVSLSNGQKLSTLNSDGEQLTVNIDGSTVKINDATVVAADVTVKNGVIHAIDTVLVPDLGPTDAAWGARPSLLMALTLALLTYFYRC